MVVPLLQALMQPGVLWSSEVVHALGLHLQILGPLSFKMEIVVTEEQALQRAAAPGLLRMRGSARVADLQFLLYWRPARI